MTEGQLSIDDALPPSLPYGVPGTQGWSGSDTSKERAEREARDGTASERQRYVLKVAATLGADGMTVAELRANTDLHHGSASGVLSVLHLDGKLARLKERRGRCQIYVLPSHVNGRETVPHKSIRSRDSERVLARVIELLGEGRSFEALEVGRAWLGRTDG